MQYITTGKKQKGWLGERITLGTKNGGTSGSRRIFDSPADLCYPPAERSGLFPKGTAPSLLYKNPRLWQRGFSFVFGF
jgi:hypothetical protein